jgi:hypothetical protein
MLKKAWVFLCMPTGAGTVCIKGINFFRAPFGISMNMDFLKSWNCEAPEFKKPLNRAF